MINLRILPFVIAAAALLLSVKVGDLWTGLTRDGALPIRTATAQQRPTPLTPPSEETAAAEPTAPEDAPAEPEGDAVQPMGTAQKQRDEFADITRFTQSELDLLQALGERRRILDERAVDLDRRESLMQAAEARIDQKIEELKSIQSKIEQLVRENEDQKNADMDRLARIYETMKPKDAARIFEDLDQFVLIEVAQRMKNRSLAPILAAMEATKARSLTGELARLRDLPGFTLPMSTEG